MHVFFSYYSLLKLINFNMQKSKVDISEITLNDEKYLFSLLQKQNESGILFNDRIFFLVPDKYIGYVSDIKASDPQYIPFQKAKQKIGIQNIKTVLVNEKEFKIKYNALEESKKVEKVWLFRVIESSLAKKWQDRIQYEKSKQIIRKQPPPPVEHQLSPKKAIIKSNSPLNRSRKNLGFSRAIQLSQHPKKMTSSIEVGTDPVQKQPEIKSPVRQTQMKQMGTIISQRDSVSQFHEKVQPVSKKDAQVETSFVEDKQKQDDKCAQDRIPDYTDRSMPPEPNKIGKSIRSEPIGNKITPQYYSHNDPIHKEEQNKQEEKKSQQPPQNTKQPVLQNKKQNKSQIHSESPNMAILNKSIHTRTEKQKSNKVESEVTSRSNIALPSKIGQPLKVDQSVQKTEKSKIDQSVQPVQAQRIDKSIQMTNRSRSKMQSEIPDKSRIIEESKNHYEKLQQSKINKTKVSQPYIIVTKSQDIKSQDKNQQLNQSLLDQTFKDISKIDKSKEFLNEKSSFYYPYVQDSVQLNDKKQKVQLQKSKKPSLSNMKYISPEEYEKLNLSASYYERASKLIKKSSVPKTKWNNQSQLSKSDLANNLQSQTKRNVSIKALQDKKSNNDIERRSTSQQNSAKKNLDRLLFPTGQKSIQEEVESFADQLQEVPWAFKYVKYNELMFEEYLDFTYDLMQQLIIDLARPKQTQLYSLTYIKDSIRYYEVKDIEVKIALIQLSTKQKGSRGSQKVFNINNIKQLRNQFKNFKALYQYLQNSSNLKVPLICLHQINGFLGSFKIKVKASEQQIKLKQIEDSLNRLKVKSNIDHNFYQNYNKNLVKLDKSYYNEFKDKNNQYDQKINFDCIFIQEMDDYLIPDLVADYEKPQLAILRKELIVDYTHNISKDKQTFFSKKSSKKIMQNLSQNVLKKISQLIFQINGICVYFFNSKQISSYLHEKGINIRYLGYIYEYLTAGFQKDLFMTEMAARSCKALLRKTLQDLTLEGKQGRVNLLLKAYDFLNCVLGNSKETNAIWKVLAIHCKNYFGVDLCFDQINPGQLIICLVQNCKLDVIWQKINPDEAFKSSFFFSQRNLIGFKHIYQIYQPVYNDMYQICQEILNKEQNQQSYQRMIDYLSLQKNKFPKVLQSLQQKIKKYFLLFQSPDSDKLGIYHQEINYPSKFNFDKRIIKINWELKNDDKQKYIESCNDFLRLVTKFYGEFHPIFSVLYDTFSSYHLANDNFQDAITFAKSSLVNMLKICGTTHQKTAESYFKLGGCYMKAKKNDEYISNFKKAKKILQDKRQTDTLFYAIILLKLALLSLNDNNLQQSLRNANRSLTILQKLGTKQSENQLIQCYQTISRCYQLQRNINQLRQLSRRIANKLPIIESQTNLQKILKIYFYPILSDINSQSASNYLDIISQLHPPNNQQNYKITFKLLKKRIIQGKFNEIVFEYMHKINSIDSYIRETNLLKDWESFKDEYQRQTVNDFVSLTQELICFLGQGFVGGTLRQAL